MTADATWMIDRLESRGLVERRMLPTDRRVKTVALTPLGASTKAELLTRLHEPPADFLALDRATLEALRDALARLPAAAWRRIARALEAAGGARLASRYSPINQSTTPPTIQPSSRPRRRQGAS